MWVNEWAWQKEEQVQSPEARGTVAGVKDRESQWPCFRQWLPRGVGGDVERRLWSCRL